MNRFSSTTFLTPMPKPVHDPGTFGAFLINAAFGAGTVSATAFAATALGSIVISIATSWAVAALTPKPDFSGLNRGLQTNVREAAAAQEYVYGQVRKGGVITYAEATGTNNKYLHQIIVLAGHEVEEIGDVYINDEIVTIKETDTFDYTVEVSYVVSGGPDGGQTYYYEVDVTDASTVYEINDTLTGDEVDALIVDGGGTPDEDYTSGRILRKSGGIGTVTGDVWQNRILIKKFDGSQTTADSDILDNLSVDSNFIGKGIAYLYVRLEYDPNVFANGIPLFTAVVKGKKVADPRTSTTGWTSNAALCIRDYITDARGLNDSDVDNTLFGAAANVCDENVRLDRTIDAGDFVVGQLYEIATVGTTDFTAIGASANTIGVFFVATGVGAGTGTAHEAEKRYTMNGVISGDTAIGNVLESMLTTCTGTLFWGAGTWRLKAGDYTTPVKTFTLDDLRSGISIDTRISMRDNFNSVKGTFIDAEQDWIQASYPTYESATFLSEDNDVPVSLDLDLPLTTSPATAQRIAKLTLLRAREQITVSADFGMEALEVEPGDIIEFDADRYGWSNKEFEVIDWRFSPNQDEGDLRITMTLREISEAAFDWDADEAQIISNNSNLPDPLIGFTISNLSVTGGGRLQKDGTFLNSALLTWDEATNEFVNHYDVEWRPLLDSSYSAAVANTNSIEITPLVDGVNYIFRVRAVSDLGTVGDWADTTFIAGGDTTAPGLPTSLAANGGFGYITVQWTNPTDNDFSHVEIWENTSNTTSGANQVGISSGDEFVRTNLGISETKWYFLKSVDYSGNKSAFTSGVSGTSTFIDDADFADGVYSLFTDQGLYAIRDVTGLPVSGAFTGEKVFNRTDGKLYEWDGTDWVLVISAVEAPDISGQLATAQIQTAAVTADLIATGAVIETKLAALAVTADKVASSAITTTKIANNAVEAAKIASSAVTEDKLGASAVTETKIANSAITTAKIASAAVTAGELASNAVTEAKLANLAVTAGKVADSAITTAKIASGAVTAGELASNAVTEAKLANLAVTAGKVADSAITTAKIASGAVTAGELASNSVTAIKVATGAITETKISDNAITTPKIAAGAVTAGEISAGAVTTAKIAAGAVTASEIAAGTITGDKIAANTLTATNIAASAITASELAANAVTTDKLAANSITSAKIAAGTIEASDIAAGTITGDKIAANTLTATNIAANAITASELAANAVTTDKLAANSITSAKIAAGTIEAADIAAGTITSNEIATNTITASNIAAGEINANHIRVSGGGSNLVLDTTVENLDYWRNSGSSNIGEIALDPLVNPDAWESVNALELTGLGNVYTIAAIPQMALKPGSKYDVSAHMMYDGNGSFYLQAQSNTAPDFSGTSAFSTVLSATTTSRALQQSEYTVPSDKPFVRFRVVKGNNGCLLGRIGGLKIRSKADSSLIVDGAITTDLLAANSVTSAKIVAGTIQAADIAAGTITSNEIATNTITATNIAANAINASELNANAVTADKIAANAVTTAKIAAGAVTADEIASNSITSAKIVAGTIQASDIATGTITATQIAGGTITGNKISANTITGGLLATSGIITSSAQIGDSLITNAKIANAAITNAKISDLSANKINAGSLSADYISIDGITLDSDGSGNLIIKNGGVDTTQIKNLAVGTAKVQDDAITNYYESVGGGTDKEIPITNNTGVTVDLLIMAFIKGEHTATQPTIRVRLYKETSSGTTANEIGEMEEIGPDTTPSSNTIKLTGTAVVTTTQNDGITRYYRAVGTNCSQIDLVIFQRQK